MRSARSSACASEAMSAALPKKRDSVTDRLTLSQMPACHAGLIARDTASLTRSGTNLAQPETGQLQYIYDDPGSISHF